MPIPGFIDAGQPDKLLPPGIHEASIDDVEKRLSAGFPSSNSRAEILQLWRSFRHLLRTLVPVEREFINGSFVTSREDPEDIDVTFWIRQEAIDALPAPRYDALRHLLNTARPIYKTHAVNVYLLPKGHHLATRSDALKRSIGDFWSTYKDPDDNVVPGVLKGYVEVVEASE